MGLLKSRSSSSKSSSKSSSSRSSSSRRISSSSSRTSSSSRGGSLIKGVASGNKSSSSSSRGGSYTSGSLLNGSGGKSSSSSGSRGGSYTSGSLLNGSGGKSSSGSRGGSYTSGSLLSGTGGKSSSSNSSDYWSLPSGAKKVNTGGSPSSPSRPSTGAGSGSLLKPPAANTGSAGGSKSGVLGAYTDTPYSPGASNEADVPRYSSPGFKPISTPNNTLIKGYNGGKLGKDGIVRYPEGVHVDRDKAAKAQAFFDYSYGERNGGSSEMRALYGDAYERELQRLANLKVGEPAWGTPQTGGSDIPHTQIGGGGGAYGGDTGGGDTGGGAYGGGTGGGAYGGGTGDGAYGEGGGTGFDTGGMPSLDLPDAPNIDYSGLMDQLTGLINSIGGLKPITPETGGTTPGTSGAAGAPEISQEDQAYLDALAEAQRHSAEALQKQVEQGVNAINSQKDPLRSDFEKAAQQAFIAKMKGQKNLPEQLAAQGLTGGATESANLALEANYGNGINDLTNTYNQGISQLDQKAAELEANGGIAIAQNSSQFEQMKAGAAQQAQQMATQIQAQKDMQAQQLQAQQNLAEYNAKISTLQQAASLAAQLGMTQYQAQINAQLKQYEAAAQQAMARYQAAKEAELQAQRLAAQFDMTKYQSQAEAQQREAQRLWEQQQQKAQQDWQKEYAKYQNDLDFENWSKKQGFRSAGSGSGGTVDFGSADEGRASPAMARAMQLMAENDTYQPHGARDLLDTPQDYASIIGSQQMTEAEKKRRLTALGYSYL